MTGLTADVPESRPLDFPRLHRLVRLRRRLRRLCGLALLAVPICALVVIAVQAWVPRSNPLWDQAGDAADPVILALLALAGVALLGLLLTRIGPLSRIGGSGSRVAARIAPVVGSRAAIRLEPEDETARALTRMLDQRPRVPLTLVALLLAAVGFAVATGVNAGPAFAGNHGHGGSVYTVGEDASLDRIDRTGRTPTYFLETPQGSVLAEDGRPRDGQRWTVVHGSSDAAYRVGGHTWLLIGALFVIGVLFGIGVLLALVSRFLAETARRREGGHRSAADTLDAGRAGTRRMLLVADDAPRPVGFDSLRGRPARQVLRRRQTVVAGVVVVLLVAAGTVAVLYRAAVLWPPDTRDVRIPPLAANGFEDESVYVTYDHPKASIDLAENALGARPTDAWSLSLGEVTGGGRAYASVDVIRLPRRVAPATAVADVAAFDERLRVYDKGSPPLPVQAAPGWSGYVSGARDDRQGTFVFANRDWLLWGTTNGGATDRELGELAARASTAIHAYGEGRLVSATRRHR